MSHISKRNNSLNERIKRKIPDSSKKIILEVKKENNYLEFHYRSKIKLKITRRELGEFIKIRKHSNNASKFLDFFSYLKDGNWKENIFLKKSSGRVVLPSYVLLTTEIKGLGSNFLVEFNSQDVYEDEFKIVFEFKIVNLQNSDVTWVTNKELDGLLDDYKTLNNKRGSIKNDESTFVVVQRIIVQSSTDLFYRKVLLLFFRKFFHNLESKNNIGESTFIKTIIINNNDLVFVGSSNIKYDEKDIYKFWKTKLFRYVKLFEYETKMIFDKYYLYCSRLINSNIEETIFYATLREKINLIRSGNFIKSMKETYPFNIHNVKYKNIINTSYNEIYLYRESILRDIADEHFYSEIFKINEEDEIKFYGVKIDSKKHVDLYKYDYYSFRKITESLYKKVIKLKLEGDNVKNIIITPLSFQILLNSNFYNIKRKNINFFIKDIEVNDERTIRFIKTSKVIQEISFIISDYFEKTIEMIYKIKPARIIISSEFLEKVSDDYLYEKFLFRVQKYIDENETVKLIEIN